jgi:hypothetical protein
MDHERSATAPIREPDVASPGVLSADVPAGAQVDGADDRSDVADRVTDHQGIVWNR